jgi:hypothetical protein
VNAQCWSTLKVDGSPEFDDGLSAAISAVMRSGAVDYLTARAIVHALHNAGYVS